MTLVEFDVPDVGEGLAEIEILEWFADVGDRVEADQVLCQGETDKSVVDIPAPATGMLMERCVEAGAIAKVGQRLAVIETSSDVMTDPTTGAAGRTAANTVSGQPHRRPLASPHTRRLAGERGIDLATITGTGPHGRVLEADLDASQSANAAPGAGATLRAVMPKTALATQDAAPTAMRRNRASETIRLSGVRRATARSMTQALTIPHITEFRQVDATKLLAARRALRPQFEARGRSLTVFPLLLAAVIRALRLRPSMNATYDPALEAVTRYTTVDLGIATTTDDGLLVPVIRDADTRSLDDLAAEVDRLVTGARTRNLTHQELSEGTFTVTNFGSLGTWLGSPLIRPPEVGIAGFGRIADAVLAVDGQPAVRPVLPIIVATDHRVQDGSDLAGFVDDIAAAAAEPLLLLT